MAGCDERVAAARDVLRRGGSVRSADRAETNAIMAEKLAEMTAKQPTPAEAAEGHQWLLQQKPGEDNRRMDEELKRRGYDFGAAYAAINRGDRDEAERFLQALAPMAGFPAHHGSHPVQRPREHRTASRTRATRRSRTRAGPSSSSDDDLEPDDFLRNLCARVVSLNEALEDGDTGLARDLARDLESDLIDRLPSPPKARCRFCGLEDWPGLVERHERIVHANELLDLEDSERRAA